MGTGMRKWARDLVYFASIGFSVAFSVFIGLGIGLYIDKRLGTSPWMMFIFLFLGIIAGFRNIGLAVKRSKDM